MSNLKVQMPKQSKVDYNEYMAKKIMLFITILFLTFLVVRVTWADQLDDITKQLSDLQHNYDLINSANQTNKGQLDKLNTQLSQIKNQVIKVEQSIQRKELEVTQGEKVLQYQKKLLNERALKYYKNINKSSFSLINILVGDQFNVSVRNFFYQKSLIDDDKNAIIQIVTYIKGLEDKKKELLSENQRLVTIKAEIDKQASFLAGEVAKANKGLSELQNKISDLSAQQQQLIAAKQSVLSSSAGRSIDTQTSSSACSPQSTSYPSTIRVKLSDGSVQSYNFENEYLKAIGEMPDSWQNLDAFKAQAVAARSYALYKMVRASCRDFDVYSSTQDQVFLYDSNSKSPQIKSGLWSQAVDETKGQFLQNGGNVIIAYYSANSGGHTLSPQEAWNGGGGYPLGVDDMGADGKGNGDLNARCVGTLRWEYHYNVGREGKVQYNDTCSGGDINNNNSPMSNSEVEDIVDATIWSLKNGKVPDNSLSHDQIKNEIGGDAIGSIQSISASITENKYTNNVHVSGSNRTVDFSGDQAQSFRLVFNIRSPGQFLIPSTAYGAHFVKFDILSSNDAHGTQGQGWYFYTYGYGHRIGLDQEGALGMAVQGKNYTDILSHYYQGTSLTSKDYSGQVQ